MQSSIAEEGGVKTVRVTATIDGTTRFATAQTVTVTVGKDGDSATKGTDYAMVGVQSIEIPIGDASAYVDFMLTPSTDVLFEGSETISLEGTLTDVTFTNTAITITDDDEAPSTITLSVDADTGTNNVQSSIAEEGGRQDGAGHCDHHQRHALRHRADGHGNGGARTATPPRRARTTRW